MLTESLSTKRHLTNQLEKMIASGYHKLLQIPEDKYISEMTEVIDRQNYETEIGEMMSLVELRIPFSDQLKALELESNPALYYQPKHSTHRPYVAKIQLVHPYNPDLGKNTYSEMVDQLPPELRPSSPFEALMITPDILARGFAAFAGGRYQHNPGITGDVQHLFQYHCLENFMGKPRVSYVEADSSDCYVSLAVAKRSINTHEIKH